MASTDSLLNWLSVNHWEEQPSQEGRSNTGCDYHTVFISFRKHKMIRVK